MPGGAVANAFAFNNHCTTRPTYLTTTPQMRCFFVPKTAIMKLMLKFVGQKVRALVGSRRRLLIIATLCVAIIALVAGIKFLPDAYKDYQNGRAEPINFMTQEQSLSKLQSSAPADAAPVAEKVKYYDDLINVYRTGESKEDYKKITELFAEREKLQSSDITYQTYYRMAYYYQQLGDISGALAMLDKSYAVLPTADDPNGTGYVRSEAVVRIDAFRKEINGQ